MKKVIKVLMPAIIAQVCWLFISKPPIKHDLWILFIVALLVFGGVLSARVIIGYMQEANVERSMGIKIFIGAIVVILYTFVFFFTGCTLAVVTGGG